MGTFEHSLFWPAWTASLTWAKSMELNPDHAFQRRTRGYGAAQGIFAHSHDALGLFRNSPPQVDRIWLWVYFNKIPIYPIFYLLKGDHRPFQPQKNGQGADPKPLDVSGFHELPYPYDHDMLCIFFPIIPLKPEPYITPL